MASMLSKSDSGYSGTSPQAVRKCDSGYSGTSPPAVRKKEISIDEAMRMYNRKVASSTLNPTDVTNSVNKVTTASKTRNRIESEGTEYSDYSDTESDYSENNGKFLYIDNSVLRLFHNFVEAPQSEKM